MDCFAVSICGGLKLKKIQWQDALLIAVFFGAFQMLMPMIGWLLGLTFRDFMSNFDHWIAFFLLGIIGAKMIYEGMENEADEIKGDPRNLSVLTGLAIATSIDALGVGLTFSLLETGIINLLIVIGIVTFIVSFLGVVVGARFGHLFEQQAEIIGGVILIGLGLKILLL
ncbi:MAG: manganese efflux pump [Cyanobacterium sp. T60_A2020_053]|nr:manganese efflux pump [Cyanobacterium sp. T60_A2020_053]